MNDVNVIQSPSANNLLHMERGRIISEIGLDASWGCNLEVCEYEDK